MLPLPADLSIEMRSYLSEAFAKSKQWRLPKGDSYENVKPIKLSKITVVGGGTMGRGIAISFCLAGYDIIIVEQNEQAIEYCKDELRKELQNKNFAKKLSPQDLKRLQSSAISFTTIYEDSSESQLILEAIFENMALKQELFTKLESICPAETIFATNTSSLDLDEMSSVLKNPARAVGIHFLNPPHINPIVEVAYGKHTSGRAVATAFEILNKAKKLPMLVRNSPKFVFNRLLVAFLLQGEKLCYEYGKLPREVDSMCAAMKISAGPLMALDLIGIDIVSQIKKAQGNELSVIEKELLKNKWLGRKTKKGFYNYDPVTGAKSDNLELNELIRKTAKPENNKIKLANEQEMLNFMMFPMVSFGFLCIEDEIIESEALVDLMFVTGFGWPAATGGPLKWAKSVGLAKIGETIMEWQKAEPEDPLFHIAATLKTAAEEMSKL